MALTLNGSTGITPSNLSQGAPTWDTSGRFTNPNQPAFWAGFTASTTVGVNDNATTTTISGFTYVMHNIGSCLNASTGIFTAPVFGLYYFEYMFQSLPGQTGSGDIIVAGGLRARGGREFTDTSYEAYSTSTVTLMNAGDTAYVRAFNSQNHLTAQGGHFAGFLIR